MYAPRSDGIGGGTSVPTHTMHHISAADIASVQLRGMERSNTTDGDGPAHEPNNIGANTGGVRKQLETTYSTEDNELI